MVEDWRNRQDDCIAEVRGAMIDFKERWEKDSVDGADTGQVGRKRKRQDDGGEMDEVDCKNAASDAKRRVKSRTSYPKQSTNPKPSAHKSSSNIYTKGRNNTNAR